MIILLALPNFAALNGTRYAEIACAGVTVNVYNVVLPSTKKY
jgi:hypothetical protein